MHCLLSEVPGLRAEADGVVVMALGLVQGGGRGGGCVFSPGFGEEVAVFAKFLFGGGLGLDVGEQLCGFVVGALRGQAEVEITPVPEISTGSSMPAPFFWR